MEIPTPSEAIPRRRLCHEVNVHPQSSKPRPQVHPAPGGQPWPHWAELEQLLSIDEQLSEQFGAALKLERDALQQRDYTAFEQQLAEKQRLVAELEQQAQHRRQWLQQHGCPDELSALTRAEREYPELAARWQKLADHWQTCQQDNQINEQICQRTRAVVGRLLDILRGEPQGGTTYDASGSARRLDIGRRLGDA